jgi:subtilisin-like proprotein convertase family protein
LVTAYGTNVNLNGCSLYVAPLLNDDDGPTNGQQYTIINNPSASPVVGTFTGLPNGSIYTASYGMQFRVGYNEGNRNVVLTYTNPPSQQATPFVGAGNGNGYLDPNECNTLYLALQNPGGTSFTGVSAWLRSLTPGVAVTQPQSYYPNVPAGGSATNLTPFQVYTMPWLPCGTPVTLLATFTTANVGTFAVPVTLTTGAPLQFDNLTPLAIPDLTTVTSAIPVSGLSAPITKVDVLLDIAHTYDSDLVADLIAPDGTTINLLAHDGANGQNFGSACSSDTTKTIFDDSASVGISTGVAPFVGSFQPLSPLSALNGKSGASVNNAKWHLRVADTDSGNSGTLQCWSLRIWTGGCQDGGGVCALPQLDRLRHARRALPDDGPTDPDRVRDHLRQPNLVPRQLWGY